MRPTYEGRPNYESIRTDYGARPWYERPYEAKTSYENRPNEAKLSYESRPSEARTSYESRPSESRTSYVAPYETTRSTSQKLVPREVLHQATRQPNQIDEYTTQKHKVEFSIPKQRVGHLRPEETSEMNEFRDEEALSDQDSITSGQDALTKDIDDHKSLSTNVHKDEIFEVRIHVI